MDSTSVTLHVFFEDPFFVGVLTREEAGALTACRVVFGAEPSDAQVHGWLLGAYDSLRPSPAVGAKRRPVHSNPKRAKREAGRQARREGIGTKAQQALALDREERAEERRQQSRERKLEDAHRRFALRQQRRKQRHRGR